MTPPTPPTPPEAVHRGWVAATVALGGSRAEAVRSGDELVRRYAEPPRPYHGLPHIALVLDGVRTLGGTLPPGEFAATRAAAAAHDVVYRGRAGQDERDSAAWAVDALTSAGAGNAQRVGELVRATAEHRAGDDAAAAVLLDADLAILASAPARYAQYVTAVRSEYAHVDDDQWRTGRAAVLRGLLDRERIYATECGSAWEAAARANMTAELATLTGGPAGG